MTRGGQAGHMGNKAEHLQSSISATAHAACPTAVVVAITTITTISTRTVKNIPCPCTDHDTLIPPGHKVGGRAGVQTTLNARQRREEQGTLAVDGEVTVGGLVGVQVVVPVPKIAT